MAGDIKQKFGTSNQAITITLASLANAAARESTVIDNTTNVFLDALLALKVKSGASAVSSAGIVEIWAYGTVDGGSSYSDTCTGTDAGVTLTVPPNLRLLGLLNVVANATTYKSPVFSVAGAFGGTLPEKWGIVIVNKTSAALDSTGGNHSAVYQGVYTQYT